LQQLEIEGEMRALKIAAVLGHQAIERQIDFSDQDAAGMRRPLPASLRFWTLTFGAVNRAVDSGCPER
jgi:hypothetical protein